MTVTIIRTNLDDRVRNMPGLFTAGWDDVNKCWLWWENYQLLPYPGQILRSVTLEEAALMQKIVWELATTEDVNKLRTLLKSPNPE